MLRQKPSSIRAKKIGVYRPPENTSDSQPTYKGGKKEHHEKYEHIGGENDVYRYKEGDKELIFERKTLQNNLMKLKPYQDTMVDHLTSENREIFTAIMTQGSRLDKTPLYEVFLEAVSSTFSSPTILPGTVAAYLAGCPVAYQENNLGGCDPRCLSSLPLANKPGSNLCDKTVLVLKDNKIVVLQNKDTTEAILLIYDQNFEMMSRENIQVLKMMKIQTFHVMHLQPDRSFGPVTIMNLDNLSANSSATPKQTTSTTNGWWIFLIILLIIILILAIGYAIWWYRQRSNMGEMSTTYVVPSTRGTF